MYNMFIWDEDLAIDDFDSKWMLILYCNEDPVLYKELSVFGCYMYMPTILANQMQERKVGRWPFLYSSENRNQYWMAVIVRADYPVQNQPAELGELGRKCWYLLDRQPC
ncbi:hypothetical protein ACFXTH_044643 [Malus domestica]